jgi:RimJ/RimL family protein N-acetyltransferase
MPPFARIDPAMNHNRTHIQSILLNDGTRVPTRPIQPDDTEALQRFHLGLSDYSIYLRHVHSLPRLSEDQLRYFTTLDGVYRFAIVALDPNQPSEIIAVVRYEGDPGSDRAEYAALVTDAWQGKGLGTALTRLLITAAVRNGIRCFYALVLPENIRMMSLLRDLGFPERTRFEDGIAEIEVELVSATAADASAPSGTLASAR